ncbi:MAG: RdgB/HAM1 family non-canonical purine NTP pyrophosphatase [Clostridiales bacterium]|nr:RdgB/HAM1 family non-canonical purine NTP pyrophosphatase [Clostridiales bacterium]
MDTFVIATHNQKKLAELQRILEPLGISAVTAELEEVEETGKTFAENAFLKANAACKQTGKPAVADDSGLVVDALNGAPGIYSARYAGENATDADRIAKLLREMQPYPTPERSARFVSSICCVFPDGTVLRAEGTCEGEIGFSPAGNGGFGYDPIFFVGERSFAELSANEKDRLSHRGKALRIFAKVLQEYYFQSK